MSRFAPKCLLALALLFLPSFVFANSCDPSGLLAGFTCDNNGHDNVHLGGTGSALSNGNGILLNSNTFSFTLTGNNKLGANDIIIIAAFAGAFPTGASVNGLAFTQTSAFGETSAAGAIISDWTAAGFCPGGVCPTATFGFVDLGIAPPQSSLTLNAPAGTILYGLAANGHGIVYTTPNSEIVVGKGPLSAVPEPGSMLLLGSGLVGLAGIVRRRLGR
ncbi:MAG: PEP-CTERM sorting domain-containing protein [Acidobacteriaceae bacterium]|nr:PEP-CTERM sorting domain-containing protein [Acidobacteriaceae bacterium]